MPDIQRVEGIGGIEVTQDKTRRNIAYGALGSYGALLVFVVLSGWFSPQRPLDDIIKIVTTLSAVLGGIVGAIVGFYFKGDD